MTKSNTIIMVDEGWGRETHVAVGGVVFQRDNAIIHAERRRLGKAASSVEAAFLALGMALKMVEQFELDHAQIHMDAKYVVDRLTWGWDDRKRAPKHLRGEERAEQVVRRWLRDHPGCVEISWIPREKNVLADQVVRVGSLP